MKKITFVVAGNVKKQSKITAQAKVIFDQGFDLNFQLTEHSGHAVQLAKEAVNQGCDILIAVGGDGTVNEVTNGIMQADSALREKLWYGIYPAGTGNDFVKNLGKTHSLSDLLRRINSNTLIKVDVGKATFQNTDLKETVRYYTNITDIGIGGQVAMITQRSPKIFGPNFTYFQGIVRSFLSYRKKRIKVSAENFNWEGPIMSLVMANGKWFGSGMCIAPKAEINNGKLQLVILGDITLFDYLKYLPGVKKGHLIDHPEVQYLESEWCEIEEIEGPIPIDMDGEFIGYAPLKISIIPEAIQLLSDKYR